MLQNNINYVTSKCGYDLLFPFLYFRDFFKKLRRIFASKQIICCTSYLLFYGNISINITKAMAAGSLMCDGSKRLSSGINPPLFSKTSDFKDFIFSWPQKLRSEYILQVP